MNFLAQLQLADERQQQEGNFQARWRHILQELPDNFAISRLADGSASLHYQKWINNPDGSASLEEITVCGCIEKHAYMLEAGQFCKVLCAYDMPLHISMAIYRVCIPEN